MNQFGSWPRGQGHVRPAATLKSRPEDFRVFELPLVMPDGEGRHLWLEVEKIGANTDWVARQLAACAGVHPREVGFAGMKDRHAVTRQWFSIGCQEAGDTAWESWCIDGVNVLSAAWHSRKLQRGTLRGNHFEITLRSVTEHGEEFSQCLEKVRESGVPNYFGPQRFGRDGANVERARRWLTAGGRLSRQKRSLYLSAARSFLFNHLLAERVRQGNWNRLLDGDVAILDGRQSVFVTDLADTDLQRRCDQGDIHPAGCLVGEGGLACEREAAQWQSDVLGPFQDLVDGLKGQRLKAAWRSLRLVPAGMGWTWENNDLVLEFSLPPGGYATTVLDELVSLHDASISESQ